MEPEIIILSVWRCVWRSEWRPLIDQVNTIYQDVMLVCYQGSKVGRIQLKRTVKTFVAGLLYPITEETYQYI